MEAESKAAATAPDSALVPPESEYSPAEAAGSFEALELKQDLLRGIYSEGIDRPSAIQQDGIPPLIRGCDIICQAQSGTGKATALAIGVLQRIDNASSCQALLLAPSRECTHKMEKVVAGLGGFMPVKCFAHVSGAQDIRALLDCAQVVVGTPGRMLDVISQHELCVAGIKMVVLCEADDMLARGLTGQISGIFKVLPRNVQVCVSCATASGDVLDFAKSCMRDPVHVMEKNEERAPLTDARQFYSVVEGEEGKLDALRGLKCVLDTSDAIIYVSNRLKVDWLLEKMKEMGFSACHVHEDMQQALRDDTMKEFRSGRTRALIATEPLARGIEVAQVSLVVNFDLPRSSANYVHSIGRPGRFGRKGVAVNFVTAEELPALKDLVASCRALIEEMPANAADLM